MTNRQKYQLTQDNDCHWYLIPEDKTKEWDDWLNLDSDDEASWNVPEFAQEVDGPHGVSFFLE